MFYSETRHQVVHLHHSHHWRHLQGYISLLQSVTYNLLSDCIDSTGRILNTGLETTSRGQCDPYRKDKGFLFASWEIQIGQNLPDVLTMAHILFLKTI